MTDYTGLYELSPGTMVHAGYGALFDRAQDRVAFGRYLSAAGALFVKASDVARF